MCYRFFWFSSYYSAILIGAPLIKRPPPNKRTTPPPLHLLAEILYKRLSVYSRKYGVPSNTRSISPYLYFRASTVGNYGEKYLSVLQSSTEPASLPRGNATGTPVASPTLVINSLKTLQEISERLVYKKLEIYFKQWQTKNACKFNSRHEYRN